MAEASFAKTFLATLDSRPVKLSASHVEDARKYPAHPPVSPPLPNHQLLAHVPLTRRQLQYILPRMPKPMSKPTKLAPGQERSITVSLKSLRNPPLDIKLTSQPLDTSVLELKNSVYGQTRIPVEKIKVLHNKRPIQDSKILKEVIGETDTAVEFSIMVIGGAAAIPPEETVAAKTEEPTGAAAVDTDAFWSDLNGFLQQRLKDEPQAKELSSLFRSSWEASRSRP